ncbi:YoaK family protein [Nocardioides houyundeii]|uniref:YoaK family protein n=1 Tax=Nocardioides houyundeii TaxID=2045452 RepID=UPI000DF4B493|nr:YoaK family protein [Nocardioides houyundeii]
MSRGVAGCLLVLSFCTGIADAVGYLALDRTFFGNMTGNVLVLGMGASRTTDLPVEGPAIALVCFFIGAALGGRAMRGAEIRRAFPLLGLVALGLAAAAVALAVDPAPRGSVQARLLAVTLALAMGLQASLARRIGVPGVTTVAVTSTLVGLAADSALAMGIDQPWGRRLGAVLLMCAGAAAGALLLTVSPGLSLGLAAVLVLGVAVAGSRLGRGRVVPGSTG